MPCAPAASSALTGRPHAWPWLTFYVAPWLPSLLPSLIVAPNVTVRIPDTLAPTHSTGIPDEKVRYVRLLSDLTTDDSRCHDFEIEQDIGGADTGSVLWSGSVVLATLLRRRAASWGLGSGSSVLELGAGLGLVSVTASCLGASVVATDGDAAVLPMMRRNLLRNLGGSDGEVAVRQLWWGDARAARALGTFDFIVGSDLVYGTDIFHSGGGDDNGGAGDRAGSFAPLLCTMWLLSHAETTLVLAYRERRAAIEARFFELAWEHFETTRPPESLALGGVPEAGGVSLFTFRRRPRQAPGAEGGHGDGDEARRPPPYCTVSEDGG